jgi:iron(II)-dependent oxidoreductase
MIQQKTNKLIEQLKDARQRTLELIDKLNGKQLIGPKLKTINPLLWEIGHVAYFHEYWVLRHIEHPNYPESIASILPQADTLYDSINIAHADRWDLPLLTLDDTLSYMQHIFDAEIALLQSGKADEIEQYRIQYAIFHEDMHTEAFTYTRQTLAYPTPRFKAGKLQKISATEKLDGDANIPETQFTLGADKNTSFCFDNEKWGHGVAVKAFQISKTATSYAEYAAFVDAGGYQDKHYWSDKGWQWLQQSDLDQPLHWKKDNNGNWLIKHFDQWKAMQANAAVIHVCWYEAMAWCRWAGRRLPTEVEWELAASGNPRNIEKTNYPWGNAEPTAQHVNMDGYQLETIDVNALAAGDSAFGCRQMLGNVWEWTADTFEPFPEFKPDMYADYSQPLFSITKVLKGGAWTTRSRMIRNTWRNYYGADRNDVFVGFRSCMI